MQYIVLANTNKHYPGVVIILFYNSIQIKFCCKIESGCIAKARLSIESIGSISGMTVGHPEMVAKYAYSK